MKRKYPPVLAIAVLFGFCLTIFLAGMVEARRGRGGRSGGRGGFSRGGPAAGGGFSSRPAARQPTRQPTRQETRQQPRDPKTGQPRRILWLWLIPIILLEFVLAMVVAPLVADVWTSILPFFAEPSGLSLEALAETPEQFVGAWSLVVLQLLLLVGNYWLGEEFLFRSVLLPKMNGVFGKWDWLANAVLFATYHWHRPWVIADSLLTGSLFAFTTKRWRCAWFGLVPHAIEGVFLLFIILGIVLGLA